MSFPLVSFQAPIDIMNRALQRVGQARIATLQDDSKACDEVTFCYDKLRVAELRRNVWTFSIRTVALRAFQPALPVNPTSGAPAQLGTARLVPANWSATNNYIPGSLIQYTDGKVYYSRTFNINLEPDTNPTAWTQYFGPKTVSPYDTSGSTMYYPGELVYVLNGITPTVYMSLAQSSDVPGVTPAWIATSYYNKGDTVTAADTLVYQSLVDFNLNFNPTGAGNPTEWALLSGITSQPDANSGQNWIKLDATIAVLKFVYPVGAGPAYDTQTSNVFFKPYGFLREAPQDPKSGGVTFLGGPSGNQYQDWIFNGDYILTRDRNLIMLRFAADIADVTQMDNMFCEGLSCRVAGEVCEPLTQSTSKLQAIAGEYKVFMGDARAVNGIEQGPIEAPEDDFITCRM